MTKIIKISSPVLLAVLIALSALAAWTLLRDKPTAILGESAGIKGEISYLVKDSSGVIKEQRSIHNTTLTALKNDARARLGVDGTFTGLGNNDLYDNIQAVGSDLSGATPTNAQLSTNLDANPADGTNTAGGNGVYTTVKTFTASGAATIEELQLTKGSATNGTAEAPGAWQNTSITLASGDTLQITWTITIN